MKIKVKFNGQKDANNSVEYASPAKKWELDLELEMTPEEFIQSGKQMLEGFKLGIENADRIIDHAAEAKMRVLEHDHHLKMMREERRQRKHHEPMQCKE